MGISQAPLGPPDWMALGYLPSPRSRLMVSRDVAQVGGVLDRQQVGRGPHGRLGSCRPTRAPVGTRLEWPCSACVDAGSLRLEAPTPGGDRAHRRE